MERFRLPTIDPRDDAHVSYVYSLCRECVEQNAPTPKCERCFIGYKVELMYAADQDPNLTQPLVEANGPFVTLGDVIDETIDDIDWDGIGGVTMRRLRDASLNPNPSAEASGPHARRDRILSTLAS